MTPIDIANLPDHAEFGPSSLKHVAACAGYHGRDGSSAAADKGTRIHEALEIRDTSGLLDEGEVSMYNTLLEEELTLFNMVYPKGRAPEIHRELKLVLKLDCKTPTFGTADIISRKGTIGLVVDYKTGISKIDMPRDNLQAKAYVLAVFQLYPRLKTIHFAFLVPRNGGVLHGSFARSEMKALRKEISDIISKAEKVRPKWENGEPDLEDLNSTVSCRFCRHEDKCPALGYLVMEIARRYRPDLLPEGPISSGDVDDIETLDKLLVIAKIAESWAGGIKHKAMTRALSGDEFPNHALRTLGSAPSVTDKNNLRDLAVKHGLSSEEVFEVTTLNLKPLVEKLRAKAARGQKGKVEEAFTKEALDLDIIESGKPRFTLSPTKG